MSDLVNFKDTNNFNQLAEAMGMGADMEKKKSGSTLARLKINHTGVMGETTVKGKVKRVEVVDAGSYVLQMPEDDLIDNTGGVNCGKSSGWIEDYKSLPDETKNLLKSIKRVRVLFGEVTLHNPVDETGNEIAKHPESIPFIWEVDNRDAFKTFAAPISQMAKKNHILPQHTIELDTEEKTIPTGAKYYLPTVKLNPVESALEEKDEETFINFNEWIKNYNTYIKTAHTDALKDKGDAETKEVVDEFVDIEEAAQ